MLNFNATKLIWPYFDANKVKGSDHRPTLCYPASSTGNPISHIDTHSSVTPRSSRFIIS